MQRRTTYLESFPTDPSASRGSTTGSWSGSAGRPLPRQPRASSPGRGWLLVEFGGATAARGRVAKPLRAVIASGPERRPSRQACSPPTQNQRPCGRSARRDWAPRRTFPASRSTWEGWEDSAVHPRNLGRYLRDLRALLNRHGYGGALYGHFGQACVHTRINFDLQPRRGSAEYRAFVADAADLVVSVRRLALGRARGRAVARGAALQDVRPRAHRSVPRVQTHLGPAGPMNPGKVVDAGPSTPTCGSERATHPPAGDTFAYRGRRRDFSRAMLRCVGVGNCRRKAGRAASCARAGGSPAKRSTRRAGAPACSLKCCKAIAAEMGSPRRLAE